MRLTPQGLGAVTAKLLRERVQPWRIRPRSRSWCFPGQGDHRDLFVDQVVALIGAHEDGPPGDIGG
jgi:hypothetical protein